MDKGLVAQTTHDKAPKHFGNRMEMAEIPPHWVFLRIEKKQEKVQYERIVQLWPSY